MDVCHARTFGGLRASRRIADPENDIQASNHSADANPANDRVAVAPVWSGLELIRDAITGAGKGEIVVTGLALVGGVVLLRSGVFRGRLVQVGLIMDALDYAVFECVDLELRQKGRRLFGPLPLRRDGYRDQ